MHSEQSILLWCCVPVASSSTTELFHKWWGIAANQHLRSTQMIGNHMKRSHQMIGSTTVRRSDGSLCLDKRMPVQRGGRGTHCSTAQHSTAQHSTAQKSTAQRSTAQHSTAQRSRAQHSTAQHSTAHSTAQHSTAQHSTAQHSTRHCCSRPRILRCVGNNQFHPAQAHSEQDARSGHAPDIYQQRFLGS